MTLDKCCRVCSKAFFSCPWKQKSDSKKKCSCCWCIVGALISLCWMYIFVMLYNIQYDFNSKVFVFLHHHFNYFMVLMTIYAIFASYCVLLLLFASVQVALGEKLHLHWLHKILIFLGMILIVVVITSITYYCKEEWQLVNLSFQYTAPFLQFGAVGALTLLSWFVFQAYHRAKKGSKFLIAVVFLVVSGFIFLCPLLIHSPCLIDIKEINLTKPYLIGHRGAPMLAPENTMMSFERSLEPDCNVKVFETDVQLSKDRIPFLMHDHKPNFLERTTDIKDDKKDVCCAKDVTFDELKVRKAGKWFVETDPFHTVHLLTEEDRNRAENQTIPKLSELLELARNSSTPIIFDLYSYPDCGDIKDTEDTVNTILDSNINQTLIYWLPSKGRKDLKKHTNFTHVYNNKMEMLEENGTHLNVKYSNLSMDEIRELTGKNITVNVFVVNERWLFSLLWCAGASSVTTNDCKALNEMEQPDWTMAPSVYRIIWISVDVASVLIMIGIFVCQRKMNCIHNREERTSAQDWNESLL